MTFQFKNIQDLEKSTHVVVMPFLASQSQFWEKFGLDSRLFSANKNEVYHLMFNQKLHIFVGLGEKPTYLETVKSLRSAVFNQRKNIDKSLDVVIPACDDARIINAMANGISLGFYDVTYFKTNADEKKPTLENITFYSQGDEKSPLQKGLDLASAQKTAMRLVDLPPNTATPEFLAQECIRVSANPSIHVEIWDRKRCETENLHAFLSVARAAEVEPQWIKIEYKPELPQKHIGLVGKGITFDTGGLNLKTQGMVHMKCDMAGGAAVIGAVELAALWQLPVQITAIIPATENAIDQKAYRPSDVIQSYSGKTIEIIDTDAEGRLIMADALSFLAKNHNLDYLIDIATLTGSSVATLGYAAGALFSSNDDLTQKLFTSGIETGEKLWSLPLWDDYSSDIQSDIADVKNYSGKPVAGAISAAKFLEFFTEKHPAWAHIDMAGVSFVDNEYAKSKNATAFGVHLLGNFFENL